jgi:hypothetical protein
MMDPAAGPPAAPPAAAAAVAGLRTARGQRQRLGASRSPAPGRGGVERGGAGPHPRTKGAAVGVAAWRSRLEVPVR